MRVRNAIDKGENPLSNEEIHFTVQYTDLWPDSEDQLQWQSSLDRYYSSEHLDYYRELETWRHFERGRVVVTFP